MLGFGRELRFGGILSPLCLEIEHLAKVVAPLNEMLEFVVLLGMGNRLGDFPAVEEEVDHLQAQIPDSDHGFQRDSTLIVAICQFRPGLVQHIFECRVHFHKVLQITTRQPTRKTF